MDRFVAQENIRRFRAMLAAETSAERREVVSELSAADEAKLACALSQRSAPLACQGEPQPSPASGAHPTVRS